MALTLIPRANERALSVSQLVEKVKGIIGPPLKRERVTGEVCDFKGPNSEGGCFFSLRDQPAPGNGRPSSTRSGSEKVPIILMALWPNEARNLTFELKNGMVITATGSVTVWPTASKFALRVQTIELSGEGVREAALTALKKKLRAEGLFSRAKRPLPLLPKVVGVVTSPKAAAWSDFLTIALRRHPRLHIVRSNTHLQGTVQGTDASASIAAAIRRLANANVDVIVVTRGGGSPRDLWAFDDEAVVRAIFASAVPVVTAVGHEDDTTLADAVADLRAATPTDAAIKVVPQLDQLEDRLREFKRRAKDAARVHTTNLRKDADILRRRLGDPQGRLNDHRLWLGELLDRQKEAVRDALQRERASHEPIASRLARAQPQALLRRRRSTLDEFRTRLISAARIAVSREVVRVRRHREFLLRIPPRARVAGRLDYVDALRRRMIDDVRARHHARALRSGELTAILTALSPYAVLRRGYALVRASDGRLIHDASALRAGAKVKVEMRDDTSFTAQVEHVQVPSK